jgi:hypothetical protein
MAPGEGGAAARLARWAPLRARLDLFVACPLPKGVLHTFDTEDY